MKNVILKSIIMLSGSGMMISCNSTNRLINKNQEKMFTAEQINEKLSKVRTGADFPALAMDLKKIGVTYYETQMRDGGSIYYGQNGYKLSVGPNYEPIKVADKLNLEQLKFDIANHQQGNSDYFQISHQCSDNGIAKWVVSLTAMTCTYVDKAGNKVWVEHIPDESGQKPLFTTDQIKAAHSKVKSGADFPAYIKEIKALGVTHYETFVSDGHTNYYGANDHKTSSPAKYEPLDIAGQYNKEQFEIDLKEHQQGKTDYPTFIKKSAGLGVEKWEVRMDKMTCTYYNKSGGVILVEQIPQ